MQVLLAITLVRTLKSTVKIKKIVIENNTGMMKDKKECKHLYRQGLCYGLFQYS